MKKAILSLTVAGIIFCFGCNKPEVRPLNTASNATAATTPSSALPVPTTSIPKDGNFNGKGKVTKINAEIGSVELNHEEIVGLMPPMIMEFYVKDKALLKGIKVGDKVNFVIEYKHPAETIISIKKVQ